MGGMTVPRVSLPMVELEHNGYSLVKGDFLGFGEDFCVLGCTENAAESVEGSERGDDEKEADDCDDAQTRRWSGTCMERASSVAGSDDARPLHDEDEEEEDDEDKDKVAWLLAVVSMLLSTPPPALHE